MGRTICVMGRVLDQEDGLGIYAENLLRNLFELDRETRYVILLRSSLRSDLFSDFEHVEVSVEPARIKTWWDQVTVPRAARRFGADLIFNPKFSLPLLTRIPGVFVLHGSDWYVNPGNYEWWDNLYIRTALPLYCRKAAGLTAISRTIVDDLARFAGVDEEKVETSYAAPSPHFLTSPSPAELEAFRSKWDLPNRYILSVARALHTGHGKLPDYPGGNVESLIEAYGRYREDGGDLPLVIAGSNIEEYLVSRGFGDELAGVHFTGFIPHREIHAAYYLAECFVLTTLYESFSLPLVEALATGCPTIAPSTGACPEIASGAALFVHPKDVEGLAENLGRIEASAELRSQLSRSGRQRAAEFSWRRTARVTLRVFDSIISPEARVPAATESGSSESAWSSSSTSTLSP